MAGYTVTRVWGIPIRISSSLLIFLPLLAWLIGSGGQIPVYAGVINATTGAGLDVAALQTGTTPWLIGVLAAVGLFVSVTFHELGHSYVAMRYGIGIESITLWIFGGVAALERVPREWNREFWIAIAGPVVSVLTGLACLALLGVVPSSLPVVTFVVGWLGITNVVLAVFNLVPAFPMDGGRVLRALLARKRPYIVATRIAARVGVGFAVLFAVLGVLSFDVILLLVGLFVYSAATTESRAVALDELLSGLTLGDVVDREPLTVEAEEPLRELNDLFYLAQRATLPVTEDGAVVGVVTVRGLGNKKEYDRKEAVVRDAMEEGVRLPAETGAFEALARMQSAGSDCVLVEEEGRVVGVVSQREFMNAIQVRQHAPVDESSGVV